MNHFLYTVLAVGVIALGIVYGLPYLRHPDIDRLVDNALTATSDADQLEATRQLAQLGEPACDGLRQIIAESDNPDVVATALLAVTRMMDYQSMDQILIKLDDPSLTIRSAAAKSVAKLLGRDHHYPIRGSAAERTLVKEQIVKDWEAYNGSELFEFNKKRFNN